MTFLGAWLVTEYVYNPDGTFAGIVRQRRELEQLENGRIRVTQDCQPEPSLKGHVMERFVGKPVFELSVDGRYRRYHGPAVIGTGLPWGDGAMTGSGLWPDFGHNFRSFGILPEPYRQLTGGKFFNATEMVANIVGVAVHEESSGDWPELVGFLWAGDVASNWQGTLRHVNNDGIVQREVPLQRHYEQHSIDQLSWVDEWDGRVSFSLDLCPKIGRFQMNGRGERGAVLQGIGKQYGWLLEVEAISEGGLRVELMEVLDGRSGHLVGLRRWLQDDELERVEVIQLRPLG